MVTPLFIDEALYRRVKVRAALEGRSVSEVVEEGLRAVLGTDPVSPVEPDRSRRMQLPLIPARPGASVVLAGMTLEEIHQRIAALQLEDDLGHVEPPL